MQSNSGFSMFVRILLPFLFIFLLNLNPVPHSVRSTLHAVQNAEEIGSSLFIAESYRQVYVNQPWRSELLLEAAVLFYDHEGWEEAADLFNQADQQGLLSPEERKLLAEALFQLGEYDRAVEIWADLVESSEPENQVLLQRILAVQKEMGSAEELVETYRKYISLEPENGDAYYQLGLLLCLEEPENAIPMLNLAKTFDPHYVASVGRLVSSLAGTMEEDDRFRLMETGRALGSIGEWEFARQAFEKVIEMDGSYGEAWAFLAEALQQLGMPAIEAIEQANQLSPDSIGVKAITVIFWRRQNDVEKAMQVLDEIIRQQPEEVIWLVEKGSILAQSGDLVGAEDAIQEAISRRPDQPRFRRELIQFSLQNNYKVRNLALPAAREYLILEPGSSLALDSMGWVMLTLKDFTSARRYLEEAIAVDERNVSAQLHLGQLYLEMGFPDQAYTHLLLAASLFETDPQSAVLAQALLEKYFPGDR